MDWNHSVICIAILINFNEFAQDQFFLAQAQAHTETNMSITPMAQPQADNSRWIPFVALHHRAQALTVQENLHKF